MATDTSIISTQTDIKQNFANGDNEVDAQDQILREKIRLWEKIVRVNIDGTETAVILPFNTLYEPFYTDTDVDYSTSITPVPVETQTSETTMATTGTTTTSAGVRFYVNATCQLKSITKHASCTATRATLKADTGGTILDSATYVGDVATLTTPYILTAGTYYRLESDNSGSAYTRRGRKSGQTFPYNNDYLNFTTGSVAGGNSPTPYNVISADVITGVEITNTTTTAIYDSTNEYFRMYDDINGTYDVLQSKTISLLDNSRLSSMSITVFAYDTSDNLLDTGYDLQIYNGNEWFNVNSGELFNLREYSGADLDADLDAELSGYLLNYDSSNNILFQNNIKYKITRTSEDEIIVKKIIIKLRYL